MSNISIVFTANLGPWAFETLPDGMDSVSKVLEFASRLPDCKETVLFASPGQKFAGKHRLIAKENWTPEQLISEMRALCPKKGNAFFMFADSPLLNDTIAGRMYDNHTKYLAQYTFADGYPYGLTPEIISEEILEALQVLSAKVSGTVGRKTLFGIVEKDINAFDIETEISPEDLRLYRVSLTADNKRNFLVLKSFIEAGAVGEEQIIDTVLNSEQLLRTVPAWFSIQTNSGCPQKCSFCPWPKLNPALLDSNDCMTAEQFALILKKISALSEDAVIDLSLWGEPSLHPEIASFAEQVIAYPGFRLVIETSGVGWKRDVTEKILALDHSRISWIVSLETRDPEMYKKLRGEGFAEARALAEKLLAAHRDSVYVQAVRMKESEDGLEDFYRGWKEKTENIIIQKYDHFSSYLPERKVTDISPLKRMACWHVKRDMNILLNGDVVQCREDLKGKNIWGNILTEDPEAVWLKGNELYMKHLNGELPDICRKCDEYYTYNF